MPETKEKQPAAQPEKKHEGLDRKVRHLGEFTNFRGVKFPAYLEFVDSDEPKLRGFAIYNAADGKEFKPGVRVLKHEHISLARLKLVLSGKTQPIKEKGE